MGVAFCFRYCRRVDDDDVDESLGSYRHKLPALLELTDPLIKIIRHWQCSLPINRTIIPIHHDDMPAG